MFKQVLKPAALLFLASLCLAATAFGLVLWHHTTLANPCQLPVADPGEPVTCYYRTLFFWDWPGVITLFLLYFAFCLLAAWLWQWAKHRFFHRAG
ncbi:hypothetical protein ACFPN1_16170 [Lysobacter yangpyeongensis]|uniref:Uncharacterized protein n=1 Tax=Lysobacter yangpyeongensis TaxID=346182 RepID=A0ABW0SR40_9GAMM